MVELSGKLQEVPDKEKKTRVSTTGQLLAAILALDLASKLPLLHTLHILGPLSVLWLSNAANGNNNVLSMFVS